MLVDRIYTNHLNVPQKDPIHNQLVKFIDKENDESEYNFEDDLIVINLRQACDTKKRTNVHLNIVTEFLFFHEMGHKNDPYWRRVHGSNRLYVTIDKEIVELSLSRYKKAEHFANDYAKDHKPSYIMKKEWEILHNESIETINQNCETTMREFEKWHFCAHTEVEFSEEDLCEMREKYNISIIKDDLPEIKILKI